MSHFLDVKLYAALETIAQHLGSLEDCRNDEDCAYFVFDDELRAECMSAVCENAMPELRTEIEKEDIETDYDAETGDTTATKPVWQVTVAGITRI